MDHRWYKRTKANFTVSIAQNGQFKFIGRVANISPEGMFIELPENHQLKPDDTISISSTKQEQTSHRPTINAVIIHTHAEGVGVMLNRSNFFLEQPLNFTG